MKIIQNRKQRVFLKKLIPATVVFMVVGCAGLDTGEMLKTTVQGLVGTGPYAQQNIFATYSVARQHSRLATIKLGKGMVKAVKALGIKEELDIPQYLIDVKVANASDALTAKGKTQEKEIMNYSKKAAKAITERLNKPFTLSPEAKKELGLALGLVKIGSIIQARATAGGVLLGQRIAMRDTMADFNQASAAAPTVFVKGLIDQVISFPADIKAFATNFEEIVGVTEKIKETKSTKDVEIAKKETLEKTADQETEKQLVTDMKSLRS